MALLRFNFHNCWSVGFGAKSMVMTRVHVRAKGYSSFCCMLQRCVTTIHRSLASHSRRLTPQENKIGSKKKDIRRSVAPARWLKTKWYSPQQPPVTRRFSAEEALGNRCKAPAAHKHIGPEHIGPEHIGHIAHWPYCTLAILHIDAKMAARANAASSLIGRDMGAANYADRSNHEKFKAFLDSVGHLS